MRGDWAAITMDYMPIGELSLQQVGFPDTSSMIAVAVEGYEPEWDGWFVGCRSTFQLVDGEIKVGLGVEGSLDPQQVGLLKNSYFMGKDIMDAVEGYE